MSHRKPICNREVTAVGPNAFKPCMAEHSVGAEAQPRVLMVTFVAPVVYQKMADITGPLMAKIVEQARQAKSEAEIEKLYKDAFGDLHLPTTIAMVADHIDHIRDEA